MNTSRVHIRNFAIVAHIDHGKSTLADRLLEATGTIDKDKMMDQILDSNPIERERGITIKLAPVRMQYKLSDNLKRAFNFDPSADGCTLNLIDTPGHVDFSYEVSRSLAACEGIVLVVDATQGIQAQTLAHMQLIKERNLTVIPVINKIDLPIADVAETTKQLTKVFGFKPEDIIPISAKNGVNIDKLLAAIVLRIPSPSMDLEKPLRALVFSSLYDSHRGVIVFTRIIDGVVTSGQSSIPPYQFMATKTLFSPVEIGYFTPTMKPTTLLHAGEVGYIATGLKDVRLAQIGDTITLNPATSKSVTVTPLPGYRRVKPMVFLSVFPIVSDDYLKLRRALEKLHLSDSAFDFRPISSAALGHGFHCGFLGLLHAEVIQERISREFAVDCIATAPSVEYHLFLTGGSEITIQNASEFPDPSTIAQIKEPIMLVTIFSPKDYVGQIMDLSQHKRATFHDMEYMGNQVKFTYTIPLSEIIIDFFDRLKSITSGYASLDYEFYSYETVDAVKLDILVHFERVDALSMMVVRQHAQHIGATLVEKLKDVIPKKQFQIPIQAVIGGKIIARSDVKAFRKDVTQKLYGGDRTRKDKLLEAQKKGKRRMKMVGNVEIPQEAFLTVLKH